MDNDYSWNGGLRGTSSYRLPEEDGIGKWVAIAFVVALILHAAVLIGLSKIKVVFSDTQEEVPLQTQVVRVNSVEIADSRPEVTPPEEPEVQEPVAVVPPADEIDMLESVPEVDIDISPEIETMQVPMAEPAAMGELEGIDMEAMKAPVFEPDLPEMGKTEDFFPRADDAQIAVDPGGRLDEKFDPDVYTEALRKGAKGESEDGLFKEFTSLDKMAKMSGNSLLKSKALIGSDLLFDFNSYTLRQSARVSLMKVALLIDQHPDLVCWVEGHTDLIGSESANLLLSQKRAMAVKIWLVKTLDLDEQRIAVRGFGESKPLVKSGNKEQQAPNRRVEIKMRKTRPAEEVKDGASLEKPAEKKPTKAIPVEESSPPVLVKPKVPPRAIVEPEEAPEEEPEVAPEEEPEESLLDAQPVQPLEGIEDTPTPKKPRPPVRAIPVEE